MVEGVGEIKGGNELDRIKSSRSLDIDVVLGEINRSLQGEASNAETDTLRQKYGKVDISGIKG